MTTAFSVHSFPARLFKTLPAAAVREPLLVACLLLTATLRAATPAPDYQSYRDNPTPAAKDQIAAYAKQHAGEQSGALANFVLGFTAYTQKNYPEALQYLQSAQPQLPRLADYISYYIAASKSQLNDDAGVVKELSATHGIHSPIVPQSTLLEAKALIHTQACLEAIRILRAHFGALPQPDGDLTLAQAYEGQGELSQSATLYQRVYYTHPASPLAVDAASAIERLKSTMGKAYPPPIPQQMLLRGDQWLTGKQYPKAKQEFQDMLPQLSGLEHDQAAVRMGAADLLGGNVIAGSKYLKGLHLVHSEADAERNYYLGEAGLSDLEKQYPDSPWRLKSLVALGNSYFKQHDLDRALPLFRTAAANFPPDPVTAHCHWQVAWHAYLLRSPEAAELMKEQLTRFPDDQHTAGSLYFLGRLSEEAGNPAAARAYYERLQTVYPHYYYGTLGAGRLADPALSPVPPGPEVILTLDQIKFRTSQPIVEESPTPATLAHIERARLLIAAGFPDWAETEIRFGASTDGQRHLLALELAKSDQILALSLRHMKMLIPEYLTLDYGRAPKEVWGYLFPLPLQEDLFKAARESNLDPYLVAGLIRQESEFNPAVISHAHAFGLMQIMPATGSILARQQGIAPFNSSMLFDPRVSLRLGTAYLRAQLDRWNGNLEQTLAAYNAGPGRVQQWTANTHFREPAEFVESIPFTETRDYVQSVLRNAAVYRQLYSAGTPPPQPRNALTSSHVSAPAPKRPIARKRAG
jgi:soluble lytic murein transglycosylase